MKNIAIFILSTYPFLLFAQKEDVELSKIVHEQACKMLSSIQSEDYEEWINYVNPVLYDYPDGKEKMISDMKAQYVYLDDLEDKPKILEFNCNVPKQFYYNDKSIQCAYKYSIKIKSGRHVKNHKSYLIGTSRDGGKSWFFIDTLNERIEKIKSRFPYINKNLKLEK